MGGGVGGGAFAGGGGGLGWLVGIQVGRFGGYMPPRPSVGPPQAPFTSPCPPSNHTGADRLTKSSQRVDHVEVCLVG